MKHVTCNGDIESPVLWPLLSPAAQPLLAGRKAALDLVSKITANEESSRCSVRAGLSWLVMQGTQWVLSDCASRVSYMEWNLFLLVAPVVMICCNATYSPFTIYNTICITHR